MLKKITLPVQLIIVIGCVLLFGNLFSEPFVSLFYTFSLLFKEMLSFILPFIIFSFVTTGILSFKKNAPLILLLLLAAVFISNSAIALITYGLARLLVPFLVDSMSTESLTVGMSIEPYFTISLPTIIRSEYALIAAIVTGLILSCLRAPRMKQGVVWLKCMVQRFLLSYFIPLLPLYVFGFLLEMRYRGIFSSLFMQYGSTFVLIFCTQITILALYYLLVASGHLKLMWRYVSNALPSYITAFSTMSSTATIPVSVECAEDNTGNTSLAELAMPIMANIHLAGDSVSTPLLALVSSMLFLGSFPSIAIYGSFVLYFSTAMLAVSGIPGGGILVMVPVLVSKLGFTQEMVSVITALYLLLDPFGTAANVMGDGALVILLNKLLKKLGLQS